MDPSDPSAPGSESRVLVYMPPLLGKPWRESGDARFAAARSDKWWAVISVVKI